MIKGIIFDLDGTLYDTDGMDKANKAAILRAVASSRRIDQAHALALLDETLGEYTKTRGRPSIYGAALKLGVPDSLIERMQKEEMRPSELLDPDPQIACRLAKLASQRKLALVTNTRTSLAKEAVQALGISPNTFSIVRGGDELEHPKPSPADLERVCRELGFDAGECISIGDRWAVDLAPAKAIGMATKEVEGRDSLNEWLIEMIGE